MNKTIMFLAGVLTGVAFVTAVWWLFYLLYSAIAVAHFGAPELTFWQSVGLLVLIGMISSGFRAVVNKQ